MKNFNIKLFVILSVVLLSLSAFARSGIDRDTNTSSMLQTVAQSASTPAEGSWRIRLSLKSFEDGNLGRIDETIKVSGGVFKSSFRQGGMDVAISFQMSSEVVKGQMAVQPDRQWNTVSIPFQGFIRDGVMHLKLSGTARYQGGGGGGRRGRSGSSRTVDVEFWLEKRPAP